MARESNAAFVLCDEAGTYYAIPPAALAQWRVPEEHTEAVARLAAEAAGDTAGFAQAQGLGRGHGSGNPHTLTPVVLTPLPLPFPVQSITDGTSNTIFLAERR